ncbi:unnamed protein product, partial [Mesorhabditis belari]|uniref:MARVEL domain-containing protein n=1 Tax=Mesorhabditis belari TaxID=2138241 RepID=A0A915F8D0_9BILA
MSGIKLNLRFLETNRGIIKILQIIIGAIISSLVCGNFLWDKHYCWSYGNRGYAGIWNSACLFINIILLILHLTNIKIKKLERVYAIIALILYMIAVGMLIWYWAHIGGAWDGVVGTVLAIVMTGLYIWDLQILQGDSSD